MAQINPYLSFEGNCVEVMNFYNDCLGGELTIQLVKDSPVANQVPATMQERGMSPFRAWSAIQVVVQPSRLAT